MSQRPNSPYRFKSNTNSSHSIILKYMTHGNGRRLLDVGAGDGFLAKRLTAFGWRVTAIEANPQMALLAKQYCEEVFTADLNREVPVLLRKFDAVLYGDILEHLADPGYVFRTLNQNLVSGGMIIVSVPNIAHLWIRFMLLFGQFRYTRRGILDQTHLRFFTLESFRYFLDAEKVRLQEITAVPAPLELVVPERWHGTWIQVVQNFHALLARTWPRELSYQFVARGYLQEENRRQQSLVCQIPEQLTVTHQAAGLVLSKVQQNSPV